jgi:hypothetical protein
MRFTSFFTSSTLLLILSCESVHGFSSGTGACDGGIAPLGTVAGGSTHIRTTGQIVGPLSDYGVELIINDSIVQPDTPTSFPPNVDLTWTVRTENPIQYKGILVRAEAPDSVAFTLTTTDTLLKQEATYCPLQQGNVEGITHTTNALKPSSSGVLRFDATGTATLDVTVVYRNGFSGSPPENQSVTGYNRFSLTIEAVPVLTEAPVAAPVAAPITAPVAAPVAAPVTAPVEAPVEAPVAEPVAAPVEVPIEAPVAAPVEVPVEEPTEVPVVSPVEPPVDELTAPPVDAPVKSPTSKGTKAPKVKDMGKKDPIKKGRVKTPKESKVPKAPKEKTGKGDKKKKAKKVRFLR